jgi:hypothetical protein
MISISPAEICFLKWSQKLFGDLRIGILKSAGIFIGCFYVKGITKRTDWFINNIFVKNGTFTPPFYTKDEVGERLNREYTELDLWNMGSIVCFKGKKV